MIQQNREKFDAEVLDITTISNRACALVSEIHWVMRFGELTLKSRVVRGKFQNQLKRNLPTWLMILT